MRSVKAFTDGRIHVTLFDGAFDLATMDSADSGIYEQMLAIFMTGSLAEIESLAKGNARHFGVSLRLQYHGHLSAIFNDICRRMELEELGLGAMVEEFVPWRPEESRRLFEEVTRYQPVMVNEARQAA